MPSRERGAGNIPQDGEHHELNDELRDLASLHSLGLLDADDAERWEAHLTRCAVCAAESRASRELVAFVAMNEAERLTAALPESQPPPRVKEKLMQQIASLSEVASEVAPHAAEVPLPEQSPASLILRAGEGRWHTILPGVEVKRLFVDPVAKTVTSLVRVAAGAIYPAHFHVGVEHLYVLDGDIVFEDHTLSSGDYEVRYAYTKHSAATTAPGEGCLLLVINSGRDKFLP
jgi:anti-sigma factor ChrR (cupin superfamily)